ncbi:hypothetical protein Tco_1172138, partial [Tanacetum coccineum]
MDTPEQQLTKETILESNCQNAIRVLKKQFEIFFTSILIKPSSLDVQEVKASDAISKDKAQERCMIPEFRDTLIQHMESVKKSIDERAHHNREYDSRVNERHMHTTKENVDTSKALDANIKSIYYEELMVEVQTTAEINIFATEQQHAEQPEFNNEGEVDQNVEQ